MNVRLTLTGVDDIDKVLRGLPLQLNDRILQQAHTAAAKVLVLREKLTAPEGPTGNLVDSIGVQKASASSLSSRGLGAIVVGPRRGKFKGHHAHLIEYGTKPRRLKGDGKYGKYTYRGVMPAKPFAGPAFESTKGQVQAAIAGQLAVKLNAFMRRTIKKNG